MIVEQLKHAMQHRRCLTARYKDRERRFAPHAVGVTSSGVPAAFVYQYAGSTTSDLPPRGEWRCLHLDELSTLRQNDDPWRSSCNYSLSRQSCLAEVLLAVPER